MRLIISRMFPPAASHPASIKARLIAPLFVTAQPGVREPIRALPGHFIYGPDRAADEAARLAAGGCGEILLFGRATVRDVTGSEASSDRAPLVLAISAIKARGTPIRVTADLCVCQYTLDGGCGLMRDGALDECATMDELARQAVKLADAGADALMPSAMVDGLTACLREALDACGHRRVLLFPESAKIASALYGPFRAATGGTVSLDKSSYQVGVGNRREILREFSSDLAEGADGVVVKPLLFGLDIVRDIAQSSERRVIGFSTSGEYLLTRELVASLPPEQRLQGLLGILGAAFRAGADRIFTYWSTELFSSDDTRYVPRLNGGIAAG